MDSGDVNDYLREIGGADFTAKDFRTWAATVQTAEEIWKLCKAPNQWKQKRLVREAIKGCGETAGEYSHRMLVKLYSSVAA